MTAKGDRSLRLSDIHELTGLSVWVLRKYVRQGLIPARKVGGEHFVLVRDYETWWNSQPSSSPLAAPSKASA